MKKSFILSVAATKRLKRTSTKKVKKVYLPQNESGHGKTNHTAACICCGMFAPVTNRFKKTGLCPACK